MAELFALGAALCYSGGAVVSKFATRAGSSALGFLAGMLATVLAVTVMAVVTLDSWAVSREALLFFAAAGLVGTAAGRALSTWGVRDVGASVAVPLQSSANPLIAVLAGLLIFHETVGPARWAAVALLLAGVWLCARGGSANLLTRPALGAERRRPRLVLLIPVAAGTVFALADILRKGGLEHGASPVLGALIGSGTALVLWAGITGVKQMRAGREPMRVTRPMAWWALYGTLSGTAQVLVIMALQTGELSVVSPILASQPVIVLLLSALLLRRVERLRLGTVLGALVVTAGVIAIANS